MLLATQNTVGNRVRFWQGAGTGWVVAVDKAKGRWEEVEWGTRRNCARIDFRKLRFQWILLN